MRAQRAYMLRNGIHAALSVAAAGVVWLLEPVTAAAVLAAASLAALAVELARRTVSAVADLFARRLGGMLKDGERARLTGATTLALGFTLTALVFPGPAALAGVLFAGLGDPVATFVGRRYGRVRYPGGKSVAGSVAFLVVALAVGYGLGMGHRAVLVAGGLTLVEGLTLRIDDNLYLPLVGAALAALVGGLPAG